MQMPLFKPQTEWLPPEEFPDLKQYCEIAIDLETKDPNLNIRMGSGSVIGVGEVVGISVATEDFCAYYPIAHEGGGNLDRKMVLKWLQDVLNTPADKLFHNAMYDVSWLRALGLTIKGRIIDTMIAAGVVNENRLRYDLNGVCRDYIGRGKDEAALYAAAKEWGVDPKAEMYKLPAMYVGSYAERDAQLTLELWQVLKKEILNQDIQSVFEMEMELLPCLVDMRFLGVRVNQEQAAIEKKTLIEQEKKMLGEVYSETKIDVQIWAARSIAKVFDKLGLPYDRTVKTQAPSFTKNFLANHPHNVVKCIAKAREINKAHTTFIDTILKHSQKGRIHAEINQLRSEGGGTVTGRFSMNNPNLQQIPARNKELGPRIRSLFIPEEGCTWGCFDYNQQEPRLVVHYASLQNMYGVNEVVDAYKDGDADFHKIVADMANIPRLQAKTINLGLFYGMGKNKLQAELGVNKLQAEELFRAYHAKVPFVKQKFTEKTITKQKKSNKGIILTSIVIIIIIIIVTGIIFVYFSPDVLQSEKKDTNTNQIVRSGNLLLDSGFEDITSLASDHWGIAGYVTNNITAIFYDEELIGFKIENNTLGYHNEIKYNGSMSAYIHGIDVFNITVISNWNQNINDTNIIPYGKDIELSCWIKSIEAEEVILMIQCWDSEDLSIENMIKYQSSKSYDVISGTNSWEKYSIKLINVPSNTKVITVRLGLIGTGEVWFDDAKLITIS